REDISILVQSNEILNISTIINTLYLTVQIVSSKSFKLRRDREEITTGRAGLFMSAFMKLHL
ncbi:MAG: hypothetical protein QNJ58_21210, partial [Desulfobacterales bacterium]|nr:hypothetical protein [Desulfobacterales bacterium]